MTSSYFLAIDVGTSRTTAALSYSTAEGAVSTPFPLGRHGDTAPTCVFVTPSGLLFGDAAERRGMTQPERLIRDFPRRIGDEVPLRAGDQRFTAEQLYARTVAWAIDAATDREGRSPDGIALSVPAAWGQHRYDLVSGALGEIGWRDAIVVSTADAAARHYESVHELTAGQAVVVYDLGGGGFSATIARKDVDGGVRMVGDPIGLDDIGGIDIDDAVFRHAISAAGIDRSALGADAGSRIAVAALRREVREAKEALSFDSETVIPILLGGGHDPVRLTRDELESMIDDDLRRTVDELAGALERSAVTPDEIAAIVLVGGSSRIPRVTQLLSERFNRPIAIDADPKTAVALGAALIVAERLQLSEDVDAALVVAAKEADTVAPAAASRSKKRFWKPASAYASGGVILLLAGGIVIAQTTGIVSSPRTALAGGAEAFSANGWAPSDRGTGAFTVTPGAFNPVAALSDPYAFTGRVADRDSRYEQDAPRSTSNSAATPATTRGSSSAGNPANPAADPGPAPAPAAVDPGTTDSAPTDPAPTTPDPPVTGPTEPPTETPSDPPVDTPPAEPTTPPVDPAPAPSTDPPAAEPAAV